MTVFLLTAIIEVFLMKKYLRMGWNYLLRGVSLYDNVFPLAYRKTPAWGRFWICGRRMRAEDNAKAKRGRTFVPSLSYIFFFLRLMTSTTAVPIAAIATASIADIPIVRAIPVGRTAARWLL